MVECCGRLDRTKYIIGAVDALTDHCCLPRTDVGFGLFVNEDGLNQGPVNWRAGFSAIGLFACNPVAATCRASEPARSTNCRQCRAESLI